MGYFSILASQAVGAAGQVIAFEPTPSTFAVLAANSRTRKNVTPMNAAGWSEPSTISLHDYGPGFSAFNSVFQARLPDEVRNRISERTCAVQAVRLDDYVRDHGCVPDVVKIDVESAEMHVLRGMEQLLSGSRPIISLEVEDMGAPDAPNSRDLVEKSSPSTTVNSNCARAAHSPTNCETSTSTSTRISSSLRLSGPVTSHLDFSQLFRTFS
ncbi:FkbM family methyltransferase [Actinacidiphila soli]|uniref:FkbM family methyltransferase n=1 Tax=Actinacidiphila soli TaxID=2487275 RepID=UPI0013E32C21|nr:FkbM family methyltransferase [Actinacidiphila soli]